MAVLLSGASRVETGPSRLLFGERALEHISIAASTTLMAEVHTARSAWGIQESVEQSYLSAAVNGLFLLSTLDRNHCLELAPYDTAWLEIGSERKAVSELLGKAMPSQRGPSHDKSLAIGLEKRESGFMAELWAHSPIQAQLRTIYDIPATTAMIAKIIHFESLFHIGAGFYREILNLALSRIGESMENRERSAAINYGRGDQISHSGQVLQPNGEITIS